MVEEARFNRAADRVDWILVVAALIMVTAGAVQSIQGRCNGTAAGAGGQDARPTRMPAPPETRSPAPSCRMNGIGQVRAPARTVMTTAMAVTTWRRYTRTAGWLTVRDGWTWEEIARRLVPDATAQEQWLVAQEVEAINEGTTAGTGGDRAALAGRMPAPRTAPIQDARPADASVRAGKPAPRTATPPEGVRLRVPIYRAYQGPQSCYATVDLRTWHVCAMAGMRYGVRPSLLAGVRFHEGGNHLASRAPFGCQPYGSYTLRDEAMMAARIVRRHADRYGWDGWAPTRPWCDRLGGYYTTGRWGATNSHWGSCVWAIMRRAEGKP